MKRFILLGLLNLVVLTACGPAVKGEIPPGTGDTAAETQVEIPVSVDEAQAVVTETEVDEPDWSGLALVGNTDRPQFLESFATW